MKPNRSSSAPHHRGVLETVEVNAKSFNKRWLYIEEIPHTALIDPAQPLQPFMAFDIHSGTFRRQKFPANDCERRVSDSSAVKLFIWRVSCVMNDAKETNATKNRVVAVLTCRFVSTLRVLVLGIYFITGLLPLLQDASDITQIDIYLRTYVRMHDACMHACSENFEKKRD